MTGDHIGRSLRRLEDERFLTGQGRFIDDIAVPGQLHGVVLRSPHGHALIEGIDRHGPDSYGRQQWGILDNGRKPDPAMPRE
jgi:CO/xanthine dehydrogenase Mo-binding subunit